METRKKLKVQYVPTSSLLPATYNPRGWSDSDSKQLSQSIKRFGFVDPLIVNASPKRKNIIIGGHFRWSVAKQIGVSTVPVIYVNIPNLEKEKELNLRLNRNQGHFDLELLKKFDVDLLMDIGFDDSDLSSIWDDSLSIEDDNFDLQKEITKIAKPKTKAGDKYLLGKHILICGDSNDHATTSRLTKTQEVAMIYSDPPYNISLNYNKGVSTSGKYGGTTKDNRSKIDYKKFIIQTINNGLDIAKQDCHVFYWCDENYIGLIQEVYKDLKLNPKRVCLWIKNNFNMTPHLAFNKAYEPCVYATRGKPYLNPSITNLNEILNNEIGTGNRAIDDILDLLNIWLAKRLPAQNYEHPTEKPPTLHERAIKRCTKPGEIILDLFAGSGSTMVACEQMKRKCLMVEIEPIFCDLIIRRYESLTNQKAKLIN